VEFQEAFPYFSKKALFKEASMNFEEKNATYYDVSYIFRKSSNILYVLLISKKLNNSYYVLRNF
jgi:hypothetical protein